jgi:CO/xanthine dehydrogenase Mo-binding subunit
LTRIGDSVPRKESGAKVTGKAQYVTDLLSPHILHARVCTSPYAHAEIQSIDTTGARKIKGVHGVITGKDCPVFTGPLLADRPPIAIDKVRYHGEPVAMVIADTVYAAQKACDAIKVHYRPLPVVNSPAAAFQTGAPLVHEKLAEYKNFSNQVWPVPGTNIATHVKIRKGDLPAGWQESDVVVEARFSFPQSDHVAIEQRVAMAEIIPDGRVVIHSSTQSPYVIKQLISRYFGVSEGSVIVEVPFVGGGFGGKGAVQLEYLAYIASRAVGGRCVKIANTREEDIIMSPCHIGLQATAKIGATKDGKLKAAEYLFLFDGGAYSDMGVMITRAAASDCTGPYRIDNVWCDSYCMYTNHPYAAPFRGFGHPELHFVMERLMNMLARELHLDPVALRARNAIGPGDTTPTQTRLTESTVGDVSQCIAKLREVIDWDSGQRIQMNDRKVRAKGIACIWKTSSSPPDASAGAVMTFNHDGSPNVSVGAVELGQGTKTILAQIAAERMNIDIDDVHINFEINTRVNPEHWKTVASSTTMMVGHAVLDATNDAICQLKETASIVLGTTLDSLSIGGGKVFCTDNPQRWIAVKEIAFGYHGPDGRTIGGQVIGRGSYKMKDLVPLNRETGKGNPGPQWTVAAQGVEVEFDRLDFTYRILKAATVIDAGKVMNRMTARGQMMGGMCMGLSFASREGFVYSDKGLVQNHQLRTYKTIRYGEHPKYLVEFVETPFEDGPYGARGIGEYGVIGMPAALSNALTLAAGVDCNQLPLVPETIWKLKRGRRDDTV